MCSRTNYSKAARAMLWSLMHYSPRRAVCTRGCAVPTRWSRSFPGMDCYACAIRMASVLFVWVCLKPRREPHGWRPPHRLRLRAPVLNSGAALNPCLFAYVYLARPDSCLDGVPVYEARLRMGDYLAQKISRVLSSDEIDAVMPIPESSRPAAMQVANRLGLAYREGFIKNRYVGRTFIMPGQAIRTKSVRQKLNAMRVEFKGRNVLIVDDSIVRGTTSQQIVQMARDAGANKVFFASAAPPVQFPNVYGIDMPTRNELVAYGRSAEEVARFIGADRLVYQDLDAMQQAVRDLNPLLARFEASCFDGQYVTGDITNEYLESLERMRSSPPDALQDWGL